MDVSVDKRDIRSVTVGKGQGPTIIRAQGKIPLRYLYLSVIHQLFIYNIRNVLLGFDFELTRVISHVMFV